MAVSNWQKNIPEMEALWSTMKIIRDDAELTRVEKKITANKSVYEKVEKDTGVPWQMVAVIHLREAGDQDIGQWKRCLHNGERIIGNGRKTKIVPAGRGPFATWHEAAIDALKLERLTGLTKWTPGKILAALEPFNGMGYRNKGLRSPYIWASTNHQQPGKYISDGVFSSTVMDTQVGCAAQLKYLGLGGTTTTETKPTTPVKAPGTVTGTVVAGGTAAATYPWWQTHMWEVAAGVVIAGLVTWFVVRRIRKYRERHLDVQ